MPKALHIETVPADETPSTEPGLLGTVWTHGGEVGFMACLIPGDRAVFQTQACVLVALRGGGYHHAVVGTGGMERDLQALESLIRGRGWAPASATLNIMEGRT